MRVVSLYMSFLLLASSSVTAQLPSGQTSITSQSPVILNLEPAFVQAGSPKFVLTIHGANFTPGCVVMWNSVRKATAYVDGNVLQAIILPEDVGTSGTDVVSVSNPEIPDDTSNFVGFTVRIASH